MKANPVDFVTHFLNARSVRERTLLIIFSFILILFLDVTFWLLPVTRSLVQSLPAVSSLESQLVALKNDKKNESLIRSKWESVRADLTERENRLGASSQLSSLLENLSRTASDSGVRITSLKPIETPPPPPGKLYYAVPVQISASAGTHALGAFLERLETGNTFFKITDVKIASSPTEDKKHLIELMVETYRKS